MAQPKQKRDKRENSAGDFPPPQVIAKPLSEWRPSAHNARTHSEHQLLQIAASMREFGWTNPALIEADGTIIAGHGRHMAALRMQQAGEEIRLPNGRALPAGSGLCIVADGWSEAQKRAYIIADNQLALNAGWDSDILSAEIGALLDADFDIALLGFTDMAFDAQALDEWPALSDGDKPEFQQITFTLHNAQIDVVRRAIEAAKNAGPFEGPNANSNGNALARISESFLAGRDA